MIKNGIILEKNIFGVKFEVDLVPKSNKTSRPALNMTPTSITIHETGNYTQSADARMHTKYVDNTKNYVSWHFTVDDNVIIQELPIKENAWHAGDGARGKGNRTSIAIEICVNKGVDFEKAKDNAAKLVNYLKENVDTIGNVYQHNHWSGKDCPKRIRKSGWNKFLKRIEDNKPVEEKVYTVADWFQKSWRWAVENDINDGVIQNPIEPQVAEMLYRYDKYLKGSE